MRERYHLRRLGKHLGLNWGEMQEMPWREAVAQSKLASAAMKPKKKKDGHGNRS